MRHLQLSLAALVATCAFGFAHAAHPAHPAKSAAAPEAPAAPAPSNGVMGYGVKLGGFFNDQHKQVARKYFQRYAKGKECPQGMEREAPGKTCKPPVEGRYWAVGQPLNKAVETFPLPDSLKSQLPPPPAGYQYVRAGEDILLVSDNSMHFVVDMIQDVMG